MANMYLAVEYRAIAGFVGYRVGSDGSVWSCLKRIKPNNGAAWALGEHWRQLKTRPNRTGYLRAALFDGSGNQRRILVHHLVLQAFVGPRPLGMNGLHWNGNKADCRVENLRWGTPIENWEDRRRHGKDRNAPKGESHPMAKLKREQVLDILRLHGTGEAIRTLAQQFGVSCGHIRGITTGKYWKHLLRVSAECSEADST